MLDLSLNPTFLPGACVERVESDSPRSHHAGEDHLNHAAPLHSCAHLRMWLCPLHLNEMGEVKLIYLHVFQEVIVAQSKRFRSEKLTKKSYTVIA